MGRTGRREDEGVMSGDRFNLQLWLYPELARFPDDQSRKAALAEFQKHVWKIFHWRFIVLIVLVIPSTLLTIPLVTRILNWFHFQDPLAKTMCGGGMLGIVGGVLAGILVNWAYRKPLRAFLREKLNQIGVPTCLACGYDIRALIERRCPECGRPF